MCIIAVLLTIALPVAPARDAFGGAIAYAGADSAGPRIGSQVSYGTDIPGITDIPALEGHMLRVVKFGTHVTVFYDGTVYGSAYAGADYRNAKQIGLFADQGYARFRTIKLWTPGNLP